MLFASLGWGVWWLALGLKEWWPQALPRWEVLATLASLPALVGLVLGVLSVRARDVWVLLAGIPVLANGLLLSVPFLFADLMRELLDL